jgi:hypothetical protein
LDELYRVCVEVDDSLHPALGRVAHHILTELRKHLAGCAGVGEVTLGHIDRWRKEYE